MDKNLKENLQKALIKATINQAPGGLGFLMTFLDSFTDEYSKLFQQNNLLELNNELTKKYSNMDILINDIQKLIKNPDSIYILKKVINISNNNRKVDGYINLLSNILFNTLKNLDVINFYEEKGYIIDLIENLSSDSLVLFYEINKYFSMDLRKNTWSYGIGFNNDKFIGDIKFHGRLKSLDWRILIGYYLLRRNRFALESLGFFSKKSFNPLVPSQWTPAIAGVSRFAPRHRSTPAIQNTFLQKGLHSQPFFVKYFGSAGVH